MAHDEFGQIINEGVATPKQECDEIVNETVNKAYANQQAVKEEWNQSVKETNEQAETKKQETKEEWDKILSNEIDGIYKYKHQQEVRGQGDGNSMDRQQDLAHFRDQNNLGYGESIPSTTPATNQHKAEEQINEDSMNRQEDLAHFRDQNNLGYGESIPSTTPAPNQPRNELSGIKPGQEKYIQKKLQELEDRSAEKDPLAYLKERFAQEEIARQQKFAEDVNKELQGSEPASTKEEEIPSVAPLSEAESENAKLKEEIINMRAEMEEMRNLLQSLLNKDATNINEPSLASSQTKQEATSDGVTWQDPQGNPVLSEDLQRRLNSDGVTWQDPQGNPVLSEDLQRRLNEVTLDPKTGQYTDNRPEQAPVVNPQSTALIVPGQTQEDLEVIDGEIVDEQPQEQLSPEQQYTRLQSERDALLNGRTPSELTDEEKLRYFDMTIRLDQMKAAFGLANEISERKQQNKERKIAWLAGFVGAGIGFGVAMATPISVAAVVAVTLGGRFAAPLIKKWGTKLESNARALRFEDTQGKTPEESAEIEKKIKRNEWWGKRLGEISAVVSGGTTGFGLGVMAHNLFTMATNAIGNAPQPTGGQAPLKDPGFGPQGGETGIPEVPSTDPGLVVDGRVNLPGSAWNGNLAGGPTGNLPGGEFNFSNYPGGMHEMAAYQLNQDLISAGITPQQLSTLDVSTIHRGLLNGYFDAINSGTTDPNLLDILGRMNSEAAKNLLATLTSK